MTAFSKQKDVLYCAEGSELLPPPQFSPQFIFHPSSWDPLLSKKTGFPSKIPVKMSDDKIWSPVKEFDLFKDTSLKKACF